MRVVKAAAFTAAAIFMAAALNVPASAAVTFMAEGAPTPPPSGFSALCQENESACVGPAPMSGKQIHQAANRVAPVALTREEWASLQRLNREINTRIRPASDMSLYGVEEYWVDPLAQHLFDRTYVAAGDCEDVALAKRDALEASGWPVEDMFLAVGYHRELGLHTVLIVRTQRGDLVLDSRTPWVTEWSDAPYIWTKRQVSGDSKQWIKPYAGSEAGAMLASTIEASGGDQTAVATPPLDRSVH